MRPTGVLLVVVLIALSSACSASGQDPRTPTFARDVAPIIFEHCLTCHRPGASAPFSLLTYADVRPRARQIVDVTGRRYMPPWKPAPGFGGPFVAERRLTGDQIATIAAWTEQGAPEGDPANLPPMPEWAAGWRLGVPDLVVAMPEPYTLPADGPDVFRNFVIPVPISERKYVAGIELRPGTQRVHHATLRVDDTLSSRDLDTADQEPGYDGMLADRAHFPDGHFLGWTPGKVPSLAADGLAWRIDPGTDLVLQAHVIPMGASATLQAEVGFYFADAPPARTPALVRLSSAAIDIAGGERGVVVEDRYTLPVDLDVLGLYPHAHYLGQRVESFAELPEGGTRPLLLIEDWDFDWQDEYRYVDPVPLPKGSTVVMQFTFDNSSANPRNPHDPPQRVRYGPESTDEMAELTLQVLPRDPSDHATLVDDMWLKLREDDVEVLQALLARDPLDHVSHSSLGARYFEQGDVEQALQHMEEAVRLDPTFAPAEHNLATALMIGGNLQGALEHYRRAIELQPDYPQAHNNLGGVLQSMGRPAEAVRHYRLAIEFQPRHADAHYNLANVLLSEGTLDEAITHYRRALEVAPDVPRTRNGLARSLMLQGKWDEAVAEYRRTLEQDPDLVAPLTDLAWLLATSPQDRLRNPAEAVQLAERATELTNHSHVAVLDTLAAAYASDGRFDRAIEVTRTAVELARQANDPDLADDMQRRLQLYLQGRPFRMAP